MTKFFFLNKNYVKVLSIFKRFFNSYFIIPSFLNSCSFIFRNSNRRIGGLGDRRREEKSTIPFRGITRCSGRTGENSDVIHRDGNSRKTLCTEATAERSHDHEIASGRCVHPMRKHTWFWGLEVAEQLGKSQGSVSDIGATAATLCAIRTGFS